MTHICVSKLTIIVPDNGLSPDRRQTIIWTNAGILLIRAPGTKFSEILSEIHKFSFKKMHLKISSAKRRPFCLGLNVLKLSVWIHWSLNTTKSIFPQSKDTIPSGMIIYEVVSWTLTKIANSTTYINSLWLRDTIWHHGTWSTLVQDMVRFLVAPSHFLNQYQQMSIWPSTTNFSGILMKIL